MITQSNYIPWKGYFDLIHDADLFIFYDEAKYTKNDWRNRNKIYTCNGLQWLSIPIEKKFVKFKISEVELKDKKWQTLHYKSLFYAYRKAPFFFQLKPIIDEIYLEKKWISLSSLNQYLIKKISILLGLKTEFADSKKNNLEGNRIQRLLNILKQNQATEYISGPLAKKYLTGKEHLFIENNIKLTYKIYPSYPEYKQMYYPFHHDVSIFDIIANVKLDEIKNFIWNIK